MARKGLFKKIQVGNNAADDLARIQDDIVTAVEQLTRDDDRIQLPLLPLTKTSAIPAGASAVVFRGGPNVTLTLPLANAAYSMNTSQVVFLQNTSLASVKVQRAGLDTINGSPSITVGTGANGVVVFTSDGVNKWFALVPGSGGGGGGTGPQGPSGPPGFGIDGEDAHDPWMIPGVPGSVGPTGATGAQGRSGPPGFGQDADEPEAPIMIPGIAGDKGLNGLQGTQGIPGFAGVDGEDGNDAIPIPGPIGPPGATGGPGTQGIPGIPGADPDEPNEPWMVPGPQGVPGTGGGGGGSGIWLDFTQDLGVARRSGTFDITGLSGLTVGKNVNIFQTGQAIVSKGSARDEFEMDRILLTGYVVNAATIRVYWKADNTVVGIYAFCFQVSA